MNTTVDEIASGVFRLSTWIPDITDQGFTFNQFLVTGEQPFLFHCGMRQLFPLVSGAIARIMPIEDLRWISFGHVEADESGAVNMLLAVAPHAQVIHSDLACMVSLNDMCDRPPVVVGDKPLDIGGHRLRFLPTPHVPHNWEAGLWFDETTSTLLAGDLLTTIGNPVRAITESDLVEPAIAAERIFHGTGLTTSLGSTIHQLADLEPTTLAVMHGASFRGNGGAQLRALADSYAEMAAGSPTA